jgi:histidinol-phosphate aminotransferase
MLSRRLKQLTPYVPGEQPQDRSYLKLNTNENPYPPAPAIKAYLASVDIDGFRRYPDPETTGLKRAIGQAMGIKPEWVFVGNGSDEVLSLAFYAFFDSRAGQLLFPEHTYSFYPVYCNFYDIAFRRIPLDDAFRVDLEGFLAPGDSCGAIFPNPNAPTGIALPIPTMTAFLERYPANRVVIIDEAYVDFGADSVVDLLGRFDNLLVIRTCSKSMSLAGIRIGFALGNPRLINALTTAKNAFNSYPLDCLAQRIGEIAILDRGHFTAINRRIAATRDGFASALQGLGWQVLPSKANFVFARKPGSTGDSVYRSLKAAGILVRHFDAEGISEFVRITIGTDAEMAQLLKAAAQLK